MTTRGRNRRGGAAAGVLLAIAILSPPAVAADKWEREIGSLESLLESRDWKKAVERSAEVRGKMVRKFQDPAATPARIAETLVVQAIAEANLGRDDDALWHWHTAQNYLEGLPATDLAAYGRAAEILAGRALDDVPPIPAPPAEAQRRKKRDREVKIKGPVQPVYPKSLAKSGMEGAVVVKIIVGVDGRAHQPVVLDAGLVPAMAFPALEALREWLFSPAEKEGQEVPVYYELKIRYR